MNRAGLDARITALRAVLRHMEDAPEDDPNATEEAYEAHARLFGALLGDRADLRNGRLPSCSSREAGLCVLLDERTEDEVGVTTRWFKCEWVLSHGRCPRRTIQCYEEVDK